MPILQNYINYVLRCCLELNESEMIIYCTSNKPTFGLPFCQCRFWHKMTVNITAQLLQDKLWEMHVVQWSGERRLSFIGIIGILMLGGSQWRHQRVRVQDVVKSRLKLLHLSFRIQSLTKCDDYLASKPVFLHYMRTHSGCRKGEAQIVFAAWRQEGHPAGISLHQNSLLGKPRGKWLTNVYLENWLLKRCTLCIYTPFPKKAKCFFC